MSAVHPGISAVLPVHNGAAHLEAALRSILAQTHAAFEIIVVDDGSTDGSADLAACVAPRARIIRQRRQGPACARNAGAAAASQPWLAFLDHDDLWPAPRNAVLLAALAAQPQAGLVSGRIAIKPMEAASIDPRLLQADHTHVPYMFQAGLVRRSLWSELGGMNPARDYSEDVDLYLRILEVGTQVVLADEVTVFYCQHDGNRSRQVEKSQQALLSSLRASLRRRRAQLINGA